MHESIDQSPRDQPLPEGSIAPRVSAEIFWRIVFWVIVVHFALLDIVILFSIHEALNPLWLRAFFPELGVAKAAAMWVVLNTYLVVCMAVLADAVALLLVWRVLRGSRPRQLLAAYLGVAACLMAFHLGAGLYGSSVGQFDTTRGGFDFSGMSLLTVVVAELVLSAPELLMLAGVVLVGLPQIDRGLCPVCGYDLRATPDR